MLRTGAVFLFSDKRLLFPMNDGQREDKLRPVIVVQSERSLGPGPYTVGEAAALLGVHPNTVLNWCSAGKLRFFRTPGGHRRIAAQALDEMLAATLAAAA